jgi:hypothetical protein
MTASGRHLSVRIARVVVDPGVGGRLGREALQSDIATALARPGAARGAGLEASIAHHVALAVRRRIDEERP